MSRHANRPETTTQTDKREIVSFSPIKTDYQPNTSYAVLMGYLPLESIKEYFQILVRMLSLGFV